jgi:ribonuclease HI/probable phosphoglycerate mutase
MTSPQLNKQDIIKHLADNLPDAFLTEIFPAFPPEEIRDVLAGKRKMAIRQPVQLSLSSQTQKAVSACRIFTDGASRGNPGEAGAGVVIYDSSNTEIAARASYLGTCSNNVAEYKALLLGISTAQEMGCKTVAVCMDSQLIVRQILGQYKVKNATLKPLYTQAVQALKKFDSWEITHIPREQNKRADELANQGIDNKR